MLSFIRTSRLLKPLVICVLFSTLSLTIKAGTPEDVTVPSGASVPLQVAQKISTSHQKHKAGEKIALTVTSDVSVNGKVVIKGGSAAEGVIKEFKKQKGLGKQGIIKIEVLNVKAVDGSTIALSPCPISDEGEKRLGLALGLGLGLGLLVMPPLLACMAIKGKPANIESGYSLNCTVLSNTTVKVQ